jgi:glyoxylase-like metal-dependent hydrolase (beta-lactamase superfamily II)
MTHQTPEASISSRRVGDATITIISEGTIVGPVQLQVPEAEWRHAISEVDSRGMHHFGLNIAHIQLGDASILIDTGGFDDPSSGMAQKFANIFPSFTPTPGLHTGLMHLGVTFDTITHVLITHAHSDHFSGVTTLRDGQPVASFPHARHLIAGGDWGQRPDQDQPSEEVLRTIGTIQQLGLLDVITNEYEVVPGVTMILAPGETPGHSIVGVHSDNQSFYYLGDLFHYACEVEHPDWTDPGRDPVTMRQSRDRLIAEASSDHALLVFSHAPFPGWGRIVQTATGYEWEWAIDK